MAQWLRARQPVVSLLVELIYESGLRIEEAIQLRRDIMDLGRGTVEGWGKGGAARTVTLLDQDALAARAFVRPQAVLVS